MEYSKSPAKSPVNGRPVWFAPLKPGANPTINNFALSAPNEGTGPLNQSANNLLLWVRKLLNANSGYNYIQALLAYFSNRSLIMNWFHLGLVLSSQIETGRIRFIIM